MFHFASVLAAIITFLLLLQFRKKFLIVSLALLIVSLLFYHFALELKPSFWIDVKGDSIGLLENVLTVYKVVGLSIWIGLLASFITLAGSFKCSDYKEKDVTQLLTSAAFLSFIVAMNILYISQKGDETYFAQFTLPFGSWVVPILSYLFGKIYSNQDIKKSNYMVLLSGFVISFSLGFIFGILSFQLSQAIDYGIYPIYYPFMASTWIVIASYLYLLDLKIWDISNVFCRIRDFFVT